MSMSVDVTILSQILTLQLQNTELVKDFFLKKLRLLPFFQFFKINPFSMEKENGLIYIGLQWESEFLFLTHGTTGKNKIRAGYT